MAKSLSVTTASKSKVITKTGFKGYDVCANPYVGCQFGCTYCYVRFFVKDKNHPWGEFVRTRDHIKLQEKFAKEVKKAAGKRLVIGTMTDPYQPIEREHRLTRAILQAIVDAEDPLEKVGIFTRSPIIAEDIDLIKQLPRPRVHYTVSPYEDADIHLLEPIGIQIKRRFETIKLLKDAGIRVHVNVAPAIPLMSESSIERTAQALADAGVDEFFVDPMQAYGPSFEAMKLALVNDERWPEIERIMQDDDAYAKWKADFRKSWETAWKKHEKNRPDTLPIWSDHENKVWVDMRTGEQMSPSLYGDDLLCKSTG